MSKYQNAIEVKSRNEKLIRDLHSQVTTSDRDKTGLRWQFGKVGDRCMLFYTDLYSGYYGSSSVYSNNSEAMGYEIAKTLDSLKSEIITLTVERLRAEISQAAANAAEEAKQILSDCALDPAPPLTP